MKRKRRNRLHAAASEPYSKGVCAKRGRDYFFIGLFVGPLMVRLRMLTHGPFPLLNAALFVVGLAVLAGVLGTFREDIDFAGTRFPSLSANVAATGDLTLRSEVSG